MDWSYIIVFSFLLLLSLFYKGERTKMVINYLCFNLFVLFFGLRGNVGDDYIAYESFYNSPSLHDGIVFGPLFTCLTHMCRLLYVPFQFFVFTLSFLTNTLLIRFVTMIKVNLPFTLAAFFALGGVTNEIDFIRNCLAIMIFLNTIVYIDGKLNLYIGGNILGTMAHYSAIIYIPFYRITKFCLKRKHLILTFLVCTLLFPLKIRFFDFLPTTALGQGSILLEHFSKYISQFSSLRLSFSFGVIERVCMASLVILYFDKLTNATLYKVAVFAFAAYFSVYSLLSGYAVLATRIGNLFSFSYWILIPAIYNCIENKKARSLYVAFYIIYMALRIIRLSTLPQWKYQLCF